MIKKGKLVALLIGLIFPSCSSGGGGRFDETMTASTNQKGEVVLKLPQIGNGLMGVTVWDSESNELIWDVSFNGVENSEIVHGRTSGIDCEQSFPKKGPPVGIRGKTVRVSVIYLRDQGLSASTKSYHQNLSIP